MCGCGICAHPFVGLPLALVSGLIVGCMLVALMHPTAGGVIAGVFATLTIAYACFLLVLLAFGVPYFRNEGPTGQKNTPLLNLPLHMDFVDLEFGTDGSNAEKAFGAEKMARGRISMSVAPGQKMKKSQRDLDTDIKFLKSHHGVDVVVTLLQQREILIMDCANFAQAVNQAGMSWIHYPIRDKWIPMDTALFLKKAVRPVVALLRAGKRVHIHCNGTKGRSGTLLGALLMTRTVGNACLPGTNNAINPSRGLVRAISIMRATRPGMMKNPLQQAYLCYLRGQLDKI